MSTLETRINQSETRIFKAVFPNTTNHYDTLFGGTTLHMMDEAAFICATRFTRMKVVTVSTDKINFTKPIPEGTIVELIARIEKVGRTSCVVRVDIFMEDMYSTNREKVVTGYFTFVAIGDDKKPQEIVKSNTTS
ncbi:MAG TPA: acyl-CoA thioesterase [Flavobacteriaceae bacterium]|jgi:acyl-CoA hydrolase|nr:acyl-CoA thioesterase [Flavobacteriaceae bacterium]HBR54041.1 acyl-CoA thioesterase [Flavobacteriaceae bacterium]HIB48105.1 acyl-CoA thioesterase [Flavobacteriaceae bacterium]HIN98557.1 acyl-CoA thioesterase [Flavobacteriaceae bacterium]|tara:strand:+ start:134211 stop:134615 length:405 start_codon:yes stop_codon:yes gene_type:complete